MITGVLRSSPSLRPALLPTLRESYRSARAPAAKETEIPLDRFPAEPDAEFERRVLEWIDI
jgi:hypothetical protein